MTAGVCRFCSCTETSPCAGGCAWTDATRTLCTVCLAAAAVAMELVTALGLVTATPKARLHLTRGGRWDALDLEQQRVLVVTCRTWLDGVQATIAGELGARALASGEELDLIAGFLLEKCPEELARVEGQSLAGVVIRLLAPHVGTRIVMPGVGV